MEATSSCKVSRLRLIHVLRPVCNFLSMSAERLLEGSSACCTATSLLIMSVNVERSNVVSTSCHPLCRLIIACHIPTLLTNSKGEVQTRKATKHETCKEYKEPTSDQQDFHLHSKSFACSWCTYSSLVFQSHLLDTQIPVPAAASAYSVRRRQSAQSSVFHNHHTHTVRLPGAMIMQPIWSTFMTTVPAFPLLLVPML